MRWWVVRSRSVVVRGFLVILAAPLAAETQSAGKVPLIGLLATSNSSSREVTTFEQGLRDLGYVDGKKIAFERRFADFQTQHLATLAAELVRLQVTVLVALDPPATLAAKRQIIE